MVEFSSGLKGMALNLAPQRHTAQVLWSAVVAVVLLRQSFVVSSLMKRGSIYDVEKDSTNQYKSSNKSVIFETN